MTYVVASTVLNVAQNGFCKPAETKEGQDGEGSVQNGLDGTGMGAGKGDKNVSNEITSEDQVEGLQDEAGNDDEDEDQASGGERDGKDDAVDMADDFGGRMEDVPESDAEAGSQSGDEDDAAEDAEDKLDKVDPLDPNAVDDKFWGGDKDEQEQEEAADEKTNQNTQDSGETEMGNRDDKKGKQDTRGKDDPSAVKDNEAGNEEIGSEKDADEPQENDATGEQQPDGGDSIEEETAQQELPPIDNDNSALELPDDLHLDKVQDQKEGGDEEMSDDELNQDLGDMDDDAGDPDGAWLTCHVQKQNAQG